MAGLPKCKRQFKYAVRKRVNDRLINDKFLPSIIMGGADIFNWIKKLRGTISTFSIGIDQEVGKEILPTTLLQIILSCTIGLN